MIAEVVPPARDLATKLDVADVKQEMADIRIEIAEVRGDIKELRGEMHELNGKTLRTMLVFAIPMWAGTWAAVVAVVFRTN